MQILFQELKKILTWRMLLLVSVINVILYFLLIEFYITNFPNGRPDLDSYRIGIEMIETYGTDMDEEDYIDFKKTYEAQVQEANQYIQSNASFAQAGIHTYADFSAIDGQNEAQNALIDQVFFEENVDMFWELQERERLIRIHGRKEAILAKYRENANPSQQMRFDEMIQKHQYQVYPGVVMENYKSFIVTVAIAILISVILIISPVIIKDRLRQMLDLQYTSKKGRHIYKTKLLTVLISTIIVITALLIVYFSLYSLNHTEMYFKVPIHTFIGDYYWYDPTFIQYIMLTILAIYFIGIIFALLAMACSSLMPNYISLVGIQVPVIVAMIVYGFPNLMTRIISMSIPKWIVPTTYALMLFVSVLMVIVVWGREKKRDIMI